MKRRNSFILLVLLGSILLFSCNQKGNVKYFRHLRMYKTHDLSFTYPVDPRDYKKINCYRVEYDENGRIVSAVYLRDGKPAVDRENELSSIEIQYSENNEKWQYKNWAGESINEYVDYESYDFDNDGRLLSITNYSNENNIIEDSTGVATYLYTVDSLNNVLTAICLSIDGDTILTTTGYYKAVFKYDNSNNMIEFANYDKNGQLLSAIGDVAIVRYKYDENNNHTELSLYDEFNERTKDEESGVSKVKYKYDTNGNNTDIRYLDEENGLVINKKLRFAYGITIFNEKGDLIRLERYDDKENPTFITKLYESGAVKEEITYANFRRLKGFEDEDYDYYIVRADEKGNPYEYSFYNSDGSLYEVNKGFSIIEYCWDDKGNVKEVQYFDADSNLISKSTR